MPRSLAGSDSPWEHVKLPGRTVRIASAVSNHFCGSTARLRGTNDRQEITATESGRWHFASGACRNCAVLVPAYVADHSEMIAIGDLSGENVPFEKSWQILKSTVGHGIGNERQCCLGDRGDRARRNAILRFFLMETRAKWRVAHLQSGTGSGLLGGTWVNRNRSRRWS